MQPSKKKIDMENPVRLKRENKATKQENTWIHTHTHKKKEDHIDKREKHQTREIEDACYKAVVMRIEVGASGLIVSSAYEVVYRGGVLEQLARKTYHIYMHSDPNSACTKKVFCVHAEILHVHIWRWGVLEHLARKTYHIYMHSDPNSACTRLAYTCGLQTRRGLTRQRARSTPLAGPPTRAAKQQQ